ncbi:MAG: dihydrofolate reductase family protein [Candidatus Aenigmatarchaeota archaeon]
MKVILYMATTANGMIAGEDDDTSFASDVEWESFRSMINRVGNMIIGRRTYEVMKEGGEFSGLENIKVVVLTRDTSLKSDIPNIVFKNQPKEVLKFLEEQGFKEALVAGGGKLNASFMKEGLVDEIYLDIEPTILGKGIKLFSDEDFKTNLELIETKKLSPSEIQLHYRVKK